MRKFILAGLIVLSVLAVSLVALPLLISSDSVRTSLLERAKEITGREMQFQGNPTVSFNPFLGIEIRDVVFQNSLESNNNEPILSMPRLLAKLSIASALGGKVKINEFQFIRPKFNLSINAEGKSSWAFPEGKVWKTLQQANTIRDDTPTGLTPDLTKLANINLGKFTVLDGIIEYSDDLTGQSETITNFNGTLIWPTIRAGWNFDGNGIWRGDKISFDVVAQTPIMLMARGNSKITASINSETLSLDFKGEANRLSSLFISGAVNFQLPSLRRAVSFFGGEAGEGSSFSEFNASGNISGTFDKLELTDSTISLDGNTYTGNLKLANSKDGVHNFTGTLAADLITLDPYGSSFTLDNSFASIFAFLDKVQIDVRLSSKEIQYSQVMVSDFAGGMIAKDNGLTIDIGNSNFQGALVTGKLAMSRTNNLTGLEIDLDSSGANPSDLGFLNAYSAIKLDGESDIQLKLQTSGAVMKDFPENLKGTSSIHMKTGALNGLDFNKIRPSLNKDEANLSNLQIGDEATQTNISDFKLEAVINHGVAWIADASFVVEEYGARLSGKADLRSGNLAVWGILEDNEKTLQSTQFFLGGTIHQPLYVPQISSKLPGNDAFLPPPTKKLNNEIESNNTN